MSNLIPGNQKHLTLNDRLYIEHALDEGRSFRDIAKYLCKDPTTISREVRLHRSLDTWHKGSFNNPRRHWGQAPGRKYKQNLKYL